MPDQTSTTLIDYRYTYSGIQRFLGFDFSEGPYNLGSFITAENYVSKGGPIANWRGIIAAGGNATTPLAGRIVKNRSTPANFTHESFRNSDNAGFDYLAITLQGYLLRAVTGSSDLNVDSIATSTADNLAASRFASELASIESVFKGQVFAGELRESLRMIRSPFKSLRSGLDDYLTHLKRFGPRIPRRQRKKFVRDTWLEYSFGWRPLISDIDDAVTAFFRSNVAGPIFQMVKASGTDKRVGTPSDLSLIDVGYGRYVRSYTRQDTEALVRYYGIYRSHGNGTPNLHSYGFSPWEFVPTLYELIPYSFLVDYFTNLGDIVTSWSYRSLGCDWVAKTTRKVHTVGNYGKDIWLNPQSGMEELYRCTTTGVPGSSVVELVDVWRQPSVPFPIPSLELQVPDMGVKWINLLALSKNVNSTRNVLRS